MIINAAPETRIQVFPILFSSVLRGPADKYHRAVPVIEPFSVIKLKNELKINKADLN